ncbi:MAG: ferritin-like domain-containing protein [Cyanobacteria bacterium J06626_18]
MNPFTPILHLIGSGATAYLLASQLRDAKTRPNVLAGFYLAESGSVPFLTKLRDRAEAEGDLWLAAKLTKHANDERRHGQIFANALKQLNKEVIDFKKAAEAAEASESKDHDSPFFTNYYKGYSQADLKADVIEWPVFLASTYILEADAAGDFRRMARVLDGVPNMEKIQAGIFSVADDEDGHASYLKEAMLRRYGYLTTEALINAWRSRKVDALIAMVGSMIQRRGQMRTMAQDRVGDSGIESETTIDSAEAAVMVPAA